MELAKKTSSKFFCLILAALIITLLIPKPAKAYISDGGGSGNYKVMAVTYVKDYGYGVKQYTIDLYFNSRDEAYNYSSSLTINNTVATFEYIAGLAFGAFNAYVGAAVGGIFLLDSNYRNNLKASIDSTIQSTSGPVHVRMTEVMSDRNGVGSAWFSSDAWNGSIYNADGYIDSIKCIY